MKNDTNGLAFDIKFKSSEDLFKDAFTHFKDGIDTVTFELLLGHHKRHTNAHKEDMAILYDNIPILNNARFSDFLKIYERHRSPFHRLGCDCDYIYLYNQISDVLEKVSKAESELDIFDLIEELIFYKNIANFKIAIESIGIKGAD